MDPATLAVLGSGLGAVVNPMSTFGSSLLAGLGTSLGSNALGGLFGPQGAQGPKPNKDAFDLLQLGNASDLKTQNAAFEYRLDKGLEMGLTPYEMFVGGGAAGAGAGTSNSAATLGNMSASAHSVATQQRAQAKLQQRENTANRITQLMQTQMQTDAQKAVARTQVEGQKEVAGIHTKSDQLIAGNRLDLDRDRYENIAVPQAQEALKWTEQKTLHEINKVATSDPKFIKALKVMTMSSENLLATAIVNGQEYDISDPKSMLKMPDQERRELITGLIAVNSHLFREATGIQQKFAQSLDDIINSLAGGPMQFRGDHHFETLGSEGHKELEQKRDRARMKYDRNYRGRFILNNTGGVEG